MIDLSRLKALWSSKGLETQSGLLFSMSVDSTMEVAKAALNHEVHEVYDETDELFPGVSNNALHAARVHTSIAFGQNHGRGSKSRSWYSAPGTGIYLTTGIRFDNSRPAIQGLSLAAGIAVARFVKKCKLAPRLKWPNDVLVSNNDGFKKLAGVLTETSTEADGGLRILIGVGINLFQQDFPSGIPGTSLTLEGAEVPEYELAVCNFAQELMTVLNVFFASGFSALVTEYNGFSMIQGCKVLHSEFPNATFIAEAVSNDGSLLVREIASGECTRLYSGEIQLGT